MQQLRRSLNAALLSAAALAAALGSLGLVGGARAALPSALPSALQQDASLSASAAPLLVAPGGEVAFRASYTNERRTSSLLGLEVEGPSGWLLEDAGGAEPGPGPALVFAEERLLPRQGRSQAWTMRVPLTATRSVTHGARVVATVNGSTGAETPVDVFVEPTDLRVDLLPNVPDVRPGELLTHTVSVVNVAQVAAEGLVVEWRLDPRTSYVSDGFQAAGLPWTPGDVQREVDGDRVRWRIPRLAGPVVAPILLVSRVSDAPLGGATLVHTATIGADTGDLDPSDDQAVAEGVPVVASDLWIRKEGPGSRRAGDEIEYTLRWGNRGPGRAVGVLITDRLPSGLDYLSSTPPATEVSDGTLVWQRGEAPVTGEEILEEIAVRARVDEGLTPGVVLTNRVTIATQAGLADPVDDRDEASTTILAQDANDADLDAGWDALAPVAPGGRFQARARLANRGPQNAPDSALTVTLPAALALLASQGAAPQAGEGTVLRWELGLLGADEEAARAIDARVPRDQPSGSAITLRAEGASSAPDGRPEDNAATAELPVRAHQISVALTPTLPASSPGAAVTHTVSLRNRGPSPAESVVLTLSLGAQVAFEGDDLLDAPGGPVTRSLLPDGVRWEIGPLPAGARRDFALRTRVDAGAGADADVSHGLRIAATTGDADLADNAATSTLDIALPDLWLTLDGPEAASAGQPVLAELTWGARAAISAPTLTLEALLPDALVVEGSMPPAAVTETGRLRWLRPGGIMEEGAREVVSLHLRVPAAATPGTVYPITASIGSDLPDADEADNKATLSLRVVEPIAAEIDFVLPDPLDVDGDEGPLRVEVRNNVDDPVPDGTLVELQTSLGSLDDTALTTVGGAVETTIRSGQVAGEAVITASVGALRETALLPFLPGPPAQIEVRVPQPSASVGPPGLDAIVRLEDAFGNPAADGTTVTLAVDLGSLPGGPLRATQDGQVRVGWRSNEAGLGAITATHAALRARGSASFFAGAPARVEIEVDPAIQRPGGSSQVTARIWDRYGNPGRDGTTVSFTATRGSLAAPSALSAEGRATTSWQAHGEAETVHIGAHVEGPDGVESAEAPVEVIGAELLLTGHVDTPRGPISRTQLYPGETVSFTLDVRNDGLLPAEDVVLSLELPDSLVLSAVEASDDIFRREGGFDWDLPDLAEGAALEATFAGAIARDRPWTGSDLLFLRAAVTTTTAHRPGRSLRVIEQARVHSADLFLNVSLDGSASDVRPGGTVVYDIPFGNDLAMTRVPDARITATLPAGTSFDHWQPGEAVTLTEASDFTPAARELVWAHADPLPASGRMRLWLKIDEDIAPETRLATTVRIGSSVFDLESFNNADIDDAAWIRGVDVAADFDAPQEALAGQTLRIAPIVDNRGRRDPARNVLLRATFDPALDILEIAAPGEEVEPGVVEWRYGLLAAGTQRAPDVLVEVPSGAAAGSSFSLLAEVSADEADADPSNDRAERTLRVVDVLTGPPASITLDAEATALSACPEEEAVLEAELRDVTGRPVLDGTVVRWSTEAGSLSASQTETVAGVARVTLRGSAPGLARIRAEAGEAEAGLEIPIAAGETASLELDASPPRVLAGRESALRAYARDACGHPVADGTPLRLEAERGDFGGGGPSLDGQTTDGLLAAVLQVGRETGPLSVTASHVGGVRDEIELEVLASSEATPTGGPSPTPTPTPSRTPGRDPGVVYLPLAFTR